MNLAKDNASTTEGLSTLDRDQIKRVKKKNMGKFFSRSRYTIIDNDSLKTPPTIMRQNSQCDSDTMSNTQQQVAVPCTWALHSLNGIFQHHDNSHACSANAENFDKRMAHEEEWDGYEVANHPENTSRCLNQDYLVPLFACIEDRGLAMLENQDWTTPSAVIAARRAGSQQTRQIGVYWYSSSVPRYVGWDGRVEEDIVDSTAMALYLLEEPIPGDHELIWQDNDANSFASDVTQSNISTAINRSLDEASREIPQSSLSHSSNLPQTTTTAFGSHTPVSAFNQIGRYQTWSDSFEEVWRDRYGPAGF